MSKSVVWQGSEAELVITIANTKPVELVDLTTALLGVAESYRRYLEGQGLPVDGNPRLYVKEIRPGSIITVLTTYYDQAKMWADDVKPLIGFAKELISVVQFFSGKSKDKVDKKAGELQPVSNLLGPVAKDIGSQLNITAQDGSHVVVQLNVSSNDAAAAQKRIENYVADAREPVLGLQTKKTFQWWQARKDPKAKAGDMGVITTIDARPVKVIFENETVKQRMIDGELFKKGFVVDVEVSTRPTDNRPVTYKIINVLEEFDLPED